MAMRRRNLFFTVFLSTVLMGFAFNASAKWTRTHASDCMTLGGQPIDSSWAIYNNSTTDSMVLLCAIKDSDYLLKQNMTTLNIHGWDGHPTGTASAMACRSLWSTTGGACSAMVNSGVGWNHFTLSPSLGVWTAATAGDFGYVWVRLPAKDTGISSLRGYFTSD